MKTRLKRIQPCVCRQYYIHTFSLLSGIHVIDLKGIQFNSVGAISSYS